MGNEPRYVGEEMGLTPIFDREGTGFVYPADEVDDLVDRLCRALLGVLEMDLISFITAPWDDELRGAAKAQLEATISTAREVLEAAERNVQFKD